MDTDPDVARAAAQQRRLEDRETVALSRRLAICERRLELRSSIGAKAYDAATGGDWRASSEPPGAFDGDLTDMGMGSVERLTRPIRNAIHDLEVALDFDDGWDRGRETSTLMGHEKDRELVERWAGVDPETVARYAPHLGSPRAIVLARRRLYGTQA